MGFNAMDRDELQLGRRWADISEEMRERCALLCEARAEAISKLSPAHHALNDAAREIRALHLRIAV